MKIFIFSKPLLCLFTQASLGTSESWSCPATSFVVWWKQHLTFLHLTGLLSDNWRESPASFPRSAPSRHLKGASLWQMPNALKSRASPAAWKLSQALSNYASVSPFTLSVHDFLFSSTKLLWGQDQQIPSWLYYIITSRRKILWGL